MPLRMSLPAVRITIIRKTPLVRFTTIGKLQWHISNKEDRLTMKKYETPQIEVIDLLLEDIVTSSDPLGGNGNEAPVDPAYAPPTQG